MRSVLLQVIRLTTVAVARVQCRTYRRHVSPTLIELNRRDNWLKKHTEIKPVRRSDFLEWNYDSELFSFSRRLDESFSKELLKVAFDVKENGKMADSGNELLRICIWYFLSSNLTRAPVEFINAIGEYLMSSKNLAFVGKCIGIYDLIAADVYPYDDETVATCFKAMIDALDQSTDKQHLFKFIKDFILVQLCEKEIFDIWMPPNPMEMLKSTLKDGDEIEERLCFSNGANTLLACYQVGIYRCRDKKLLGISWGESLDIARELAAMDALRSLWSLDEHKMLFDFSLEIDNSLFAESKILVEN